MMRLFEKRKFFILLFVLFLILPKAGQALEIRVSKCRQAPRIDGVLSKEEWQEAAAICGFIQLPTDNLDPRMITTFVMYDETNIYFGLDSPVYPSGSSLVALRTERERGWIGDDLFEILLDPHAGKYKADDAFYHFMLNSKGVIVYDSMSQPAIGLPFQSEWNGSYIFSNSVNMDRWYGEIAVPLSTMERTSINRGEKWLIHISRVWANCTWTTVSTAKILNDAIGGLEVNFDENRPVFRLINLSPLFNSNAGFNAEIINNAKSSEKVTIDFSIRTDQENKEIYNKKMNYNLKPGEIIPVNLNETVLLNDRNKFSLKVIDGNGLVLFEKSACFLKKPYYPAFDKVELKTIIFNARYLPSYNKLAVDEINFVNHPDKNDVISCVLNIEKDKKQFHSIKLPLGGKYTFRDLVFDMPKLQNGEYQIILQLMTAAGNDITKGKESKSFPKQELPFEKVKYGITDKILPPFLPIMALKNMTFSVWGREYSFGNGLIEQIRAIQPEPTVGEENEFLLTAPVNFSGETADGKKVMYKNTSHKIIKKKKNMVQIKSELSFDCLTIKVNNFLEYDGFIRMETEIIPSKKITLKKLSLEIPIRENQATLLHTLTDSSRRRFAGLTPAGEGVVWDSTKIKNTKAMIGSFIPMVWLGNEDRGIAWIADSDRDWMLGDGQPAIEIVRKESQVILKVNFINQIVCIENNIKLIFGLQATPVKPLPEGWRSWVFHPHTLRPYEEGIRQFALTLGGGDIFQAFNMSNAFAPYSLKWEKVKNYITYANRDKYKNQYISYTALLYSGMGLPETQSYLGEWAGTTPSITFWGGSKKLQPSEKKQHMAASINACVPSYIDYRVWALDYMLGQVGHYGFYEDCTQAYPFLDVAQDIGYKRTDGQYQYQYGLFAQREMYKRMAAVYDKHDMENLIGVHKTGNMMPPVFSFATFAIDGEDRFVYGKDLDYIDQWKPDFIRAHVMGRQFGIVPVFLAEILAPEDNDLKLYRGLLAVTLHHEIIIWPGVVPDRSLYYKLYQLIHEFGLGEKDVHFYPYWASDTHQAVSTGESEILVSLWDRPEQALVVVSNLKRIEKELVISVNPQKIHSIKKIFNWENKGEIKTDKNTFKVKVEPHDVAIILINK